jgi:hypothetical protein
VRGLHLRALRWLDEPERRRRHVLREVRVTDKEIEDRVATKAAEQAARLAALPAADAKAAIAGALLSEHAWGLQRGAVRGHRDAVRDAAEREMFRAAFRHYAASALQGLLANHNVQDGEETADRQLVLLAAEYGHEMAVEEERALDRWEPMQVDDL